MSQAKMYGHNEQPLLERIKTKENADVAGLVQTRPAGRQINTGKPMSVAVNDFLTPKVLCLCLIIGMLSICAQRGSAQTVQATEGVRNGYICQGDPQPEGYSIVAVSPAPSLECGLKATLFIEKTKSGLVVCGSSLTLGGYILHTLDYIVAAVQPAPCPGIPGEEGWRIERLSKVNNVCRLTNVIGTQYLVPPGYIVTAIRPGTSCPGPIVTIKVPGEREVVCDGVFLGIPLSIPVGYSITGQTSSPACPGLGSNAWAIERTGFAIPYAGSTNGNPPMLSNSTYYVLQSSSCAIEPFIRSTAFDTATSIQFVNNSAQTVFVYWIDYNGDRVFYNSLPAGQSYVQQTFVTHPWIITTTSGDCRGIYFPTSDSTRVVVQ